MSSSKRPKLTSSIYKALIRLPPVYPLMEPSKPLYLLCSVQNYGWGKPRDESLVGKLYSLNSQTAIDPNKPYAELWMGTHESGPSFVIESHSKDEIKDRVSLRSWIQKHPDSLGKLVIEKWGRELPFLFKVLSVAKALSIQAHPDKELARILHELQPSVYKDSNHKPEMAIAITEFEALCGFVALEELNHMVCHVPEIVELLDTSLVNQVRHDADASRKEVSKSILRSIFTQLVSAANDVVSEKVAKLKSRLEAESKVRKLTEKEQLALHLEKQYPADVGVLASFLLNYVKLKPGEALYINANEPHAYICGDCIECMATSDNVVRAGLTPKDRDIETLCSMLSYRQGVPEVLQGDSVNQYTKRYSPPFDEFEVDSCILAPNGSFKYLAAPSPSIFLVVAGEGLLQTASTSDCVREGNVFFLPAEIEVTITASLKGMSLYKACVNSRCFP